jgi:hypothetical protein
MTHPLDENKAEMVQLEEMDPVNKPMDRDQSIIPVSAFADMPTGQALRKFWRLTLWGMAASIGACTSVLPSQSRVPLSPTKVSVDPKGLAQD